MRLRSFLPAGIFALHALSAYCGTIDVIFYDNRFGTLNDVTGAYTQLSTLPLSASSGIASMNGLLYVEDLGSDVFTVDPVTGASQLVGQNGLNSLSAVFAGNQNGLFEVDYASNLYSINPATGNAQLVGATGIAANNGGYDTSLSASGSYLYYTQGAPGVSDELYRINTATGVATDLGSTGITAVAGSAFVGGQLELYQYGQSSNFIYSAAADSTNFVQGAQLSAQIVDGGAVFNPISSSLVQSNGIPEPASALLLGTGLLFLAWRKFS